MQTLNLTRNRLGAVVLGISALLFFGSLLYVPDGKLGQLWQTGWLFILGMTLFPFGVLALYDRVAKQGGGGLALVALIFQLLAVGPLQAFAGLDTLGLAPLRRFYFEQTEYTETTRTLTTVLAEIGQMGMGLQFGISGGIYSLLTIGLLLLDIGMIVFVIAVWRTGALSKWASVLYALGFVLFIVAAFAFPSNMIRMATAAIGAGGGVWLAWSLWRQQPVETGI